MTSSPRGGRSLRRPPSGVSHARPPVRAAGDERRRVRGDAALEPAAPAALSFLARAYTVEVVLYYLLVAWLVLSCGGAGVQAHALAQRMRSARPSRDPAARRALRYASYVGVARSAPCTRGRPPGDGARLGLGGGDHRAASRPVDDALASALYMLYQGRQTFITGITTTIALAVFGTILAFFLALLLAFLPASRCHRPLGQRLRAVLEGAWARTSPSVYSARGRARHAP